MRDRGKNKPSLQNSSMSFDSLTVLQRMYAVSYMSGVSDVVYGRQLIYSVLPLAKVRIRPTD